MTTLTLSASVSSFLTGCSSAQVTESDPAALYKDAEDDIKNDHYQIAVDKLRTIRNKYPYSKYAVDAQLRLADVYYLQEDYAEAAAAYETFRDLHPKHEKAPYAMFRIAKSYFKDSPSNVARDLTPAQKSVDAYQDYLRKFPNAPEAAEAKTDLESARKLLADKELYIGNFYFKRDFYDSAKPRFQRVVAVYPETPAAKEAQEKLEKIADYESKHPKTDQKGSD
jgi:outer membrane protein assembly factor BamD